VNASYAEDRARRPEEGLRARRPGRDVPSRAPVLLAMLGVAAVLAWLVVTTVLATLNQPPTPQGAPLVRIDPQATREVAVIEGETRLELVRGQHGWGIRPGPGEDPMVTERVNGFLETLAGTTRLVEIGERPLAEFGLDPPRGQVILRNGGEVKIAIGDRNPPLTGLYVQVLPGPSVVMVGAVLLWEFDKLVALARREPIGPSKQTGP
jgi:hypothetical protein